jgi:hypothetical protein
MSILLKWFFTKGYSVDLVDRITDDDEDGKNSAGLHIKEIRRRHKAEVYDKKRYVSSRHVRPIVT